MSDQIVEHKGLLKEFPKHSYEDWRKAAEALLKGAPFEKKLITKTYEGITLQPIYRKEDIENLEFVKSMPGAGTFVRSSSVSGPLGKGWLVSQEINEKNPKEFNKTILSVLERGQNEINIPNCNFTSKKDFETAFKGVVLDAVSLYMQTSSKDYKKVYNAFKEHSSNNNINACISFDPFGYLLRSKEEDISLEQAFNDLAEATKESSKGIQTLLVTGDAYINGGGSSTQELGYVIATLVEYIREMTNRGVDINSIASKVRVSLTLGTNFFMEIAKIRAARILVSNVFKSYGCSENDINIHIHGRTGMWEHTLLDPYVNILRATTKAFSAVVGGCDSIHVSPFDEEIGNPNEFSNRVARNIQIILSEECNLRDVIDPAGGSWYIEWLTDQVASKSWEIFQSVEKEGGMLKALKVGIPQSSILETANSKRSSLNKRRDVLVGTNMFSNPSEKLLAKGVNRAKQNLDGKVFKAIEQKLWAEDFEVLRLAANSYEEKNGTKPTILQANIGPSRTYRARADWTTGFFEVGGFYVLNNKDYNNSEDVVSEVKGNKHGIVVITSTDDNYAEHVENISKGIKEVNKDAYIIVAGAPGDSENAWREAGVDDFVNVKVNNYEMLKTLFTKIGVI
jgi:methylmalonyl-CoA mutase